MLLCSVFFSVCAKPPFVNLLVLTQIIIAKTDEAPVYTHTLTIKKLTFGDQGLFTCKVVFTEGGDDKSLTTTVMKLCKFQNLQLLYSVKKAVCLQLLEGIFSVTTREQ